MLFLSMIGTKQSPYIEKPTKGVNPEWAALPYRRCDNCGTRYKLKQPMRPTDKYGFCKPECKKQFHKHGAAFIKLKDVCFKEMEKWKKDFEKRLREIVREEIAATVVTDSLLEFRGRD